MNHIELLHDIIRCVFIPSHAMLQSMFVQSNFKCNRIKIGLNPVVTLSSPYKAHQAWREAACLAAAKSLQLRCLPLSEGESCCHFLPCHQYQCNPKEEEKFGLSLICFNITIMRLFNQDKMTKVYIAQSFCLSKIVLLNSLIRLIRKC